MECTWKQILHEVPEAVINMVMQTKATRCQTREAGLETLSEFI